MKTLEKIALTLLVAALMIPRLSGEFGYPLVGLIRLSLLFIYAIGGYFIFNPTKQIKFGIVISIIQGIAIGLISFFLLSIISIGSFNTDFISLVFTFLAAVLIITFLILFIINRKISGNHSYLKSTGLRCLLPLSLFLLIIIIPTKARINIFNGNESKEFYKLMQRESIEKAYLEIEQGHADIAINTSILSIQYSTLRNDTTDELYQSSLNTLGYSYFENEEYYKADSVFRKILNLNNSPFFEKTSEYDRAVYYSGLNYSRYGYYYESDSLLILSLKTHTEPSTQAYIFRQMGYNSNQSGDLIKADSLYSISLSKYKESNFQDFGDYVYALNAKGENYVDLTRFKSADSIYSVAANLALERFGKLNTSLASIYDNLASLNAIQAKYKEAKFYCQKSLEIRASLNGNKSPEYLNSLLQLTSIQIALSDFEKAESELLKILSIVESKFNVNGPLAAVVYDNLTRLYQDFSNYEKAEKFAEKSLDARVYWFGKSNLKTATSLHHRAYIYYCKGNYKTADSIYSRALKIKRIYTGRENPNYASSLNGLGLVYIANNKLNKADTLFKYTEFIIEKTVGKEHPDYATLLNNIGFLRLKEKRSEESAICFQTALNINKKIFGVNHLNVAENLSGLGDLNAEKKLYSEARINYNEALSIYNSLFKFAHPKRIILERKIENLPKK